MPAPEKIDTPLGIESESLSKFETNQHFPAGELEAQTRLEEFLHKKIYSYANDRNRMDLDGTSSLSPYFRFGILGLRQAVSAAKQAEGQARSAEEKRNAEIWLNELIWREFYI